MTARVPARTKVMKAIYEHLASVPQCTVFLNDRGVIDKEDRPAIVIKAIDEQFLHETQAETVRTLSVDIDIYEEAITQDGDEVWGGLDDRHDLILAYIEQTINEDPTIGGLCQDTVLKGVTGDPDNTPDFGAVTMVIEVTYRTPYGDPWTINGANQTF